MNEGGLGSEHRRKLWLREELGLYPSASDMEVAEALLKRCTALEAKVDKLIKLLDVPGYVPEEWTNGP